MGGKSKGPDYDQAIQHAMSGQRMMYGLGREQLDFAKQQYADYAPLTRDIASQQLAAQNYQMEQARTLGDLYRNTYVPLMQDQANEARKFSTEAKREELAQQAGADAGQAFSKVKAASGRNMASMGINPNSGRFAGMQRGEDLGLAAMRSNAMTGTRRQAEGIGQAMRQNAIATGQGQAGMSQNAFSGAGSAGAMAGNSLMSPGNNYLNAMQGGIGTIGQGMNFGSQGLQFALGGQQQQANNEINPWWAAAGIGAGLLGRYKGWTG
ncbi:MAG: hypothetical protein V2I51_09640 [Anderseniella sp.]|jgi:hypothetical protein|nr:hypothetical protein [Anderseniella sp.]